MKNQSLITQPDVGLSLCLYGKFRLRNSDILPQKLFNHLLGELSLIFYYQRPICKFNQP